FLTRVGVSPGDPNAHYCLDLACDIDSLRKLDDAALAQRMAQEPRPIRRLKVNGSPLLYPLWDIDADRFLDLTEDELTRRASSVRPDADFMAALTRVAASLEPVYPPSEHVELQIYGQKNVISHDDAELCRQFHTVRWEERPDLIHRFEDGRLKRLARRLIYCESPQLLNEAERRLIADDIAARRRGDGKYAAAPWTTIAQALSELESMQGELSGAFRKGFLDLR